MGFEHRDETPVIQKDKTKSNVGAGDLLCAMFPDSDIADTFACGPDKTAYVNKFGLAPYFLELFIADANKDAFVSMFDESLNQTTKTKNLICMSAIGATITSSQDMQGAWNHPGFTSSF